MLVTRCSFVCALIASLAVAGDANAEPSTPPASAAGASPVVADTPARRTHRLIYSCRDGSIAMFSDRPCGEAALLRSLDVFTPAQSGRPPSTAAEPARAATKPARREAQDRALQDAAEKCERLQKSLDEVDDRMRAGYPARQAAALWQRWREARAAVREAGC
jgi:hypothetical protein